MDLAGPRGDISRCGRCRPRRSRARHTRGTLRDLAPHGLVAHARTLQYLGAARIGHGEQAQEQVLRADEVMPELERLAHRVLQHPPGPGRERNRPRHVAGRHCGDLCAYGLDVDAKVAEHLTGQAVSFTQQPEQYVLATHVRMRERLEGEPLAAGRRAGGARGGLPCGPGSVSRRLQASGRHRLAHVSQPGLGDLTTPHGDIDIVLTPYGTDWYDEIAQTATRERLEGAEVVVPVASAEMIPRSKTTADRPKDHAVLDRMRDILNPLRSRDLLDPPDRSRGAHEPPDR